MSAVAVFLLLLRHLKSQTPYNICRLKGLQTLDRKLQLYNAVQLLCPSFSPDQGHSNRLYQLVGTTESFWGYIIVACLWVGCTAALMPAGFCREACNARLINLNLEAHPCADLQVPKP